MFEKIIETVVDLEDAFSAIRDMERPLVIKATPGKPRSLQQNNLMWRWAQIVSTFTGESPSEVQARWKLDIGIPILKAKDERLRDALDNLLYQKPREWLLDILEDQPGLPSSIAITRCMTTADMNHFLEAVQKFEAKNGRSLEIE